MDSFIENELKAFNNKHPQKPVRPAQQPVQQPAQQPAQQYKPAKIVILLKCDPKSESESEQSSSECESSDDEPRRTVAMSRYSRG